ncbi:TPA: DUF3305 domain-containing protein [Vibrio vulnificus]|uniref:DUF3305 domain-containing protein n=1 Tax=Vibrio vulnificus TaxID=672 RepID=UPI0002E73B21|nr:DUF3305 domain-containing protein [Vibrio vulnificus]ASM97668.1 hypothetical protein AOT11_21475 [Vibrio vulnificus NBRC 15645 = ATCC 27562]EGQ7695773.1 DUF3305 domain-containing protein [Vibrio vulnificus]EGQ9311721.1 DUF3305 domain-containing protein [Vibrio vulnificus]EIJ0970872.1 DUF3305 domain-containing protein [Vibrio vulnificus]ELE1907929.1 DUF3305 domain-containing protein [Vibrio vulnificus]
MSNSIDAQSNIEKNEYLWPIGCNLVAHEIATGIWVTTQWQLTGFELKPENQHRHVVTLQLFRDERTDYRFNLSSQNPKLFVVLENIDETGTPKITTVTASQSVAGQYMDGDYLVLSCEMPLPIQAWMEAFIGRHGELLEERRKKRKGAGRASGN